MARLQKFIAKDYSNQIGHILKANGDFTDDAKEMLRLLLSTHFLGAHFVTANDKPVRVEGALVLHDPRYFRTKTLANHIFALKMVRWAIQIFKAPVKH